MWVGEQQKVSLGYYVVAVALERIAVNMTEITGDVYCQSVTSCGCFTGFYSVLHTALCFMLMQIVRKYLVIVAAR